MRTLCLIFVIGLGALCVAQSHEKSPINKSVLLDDGKIRPSQERGAQEAYLPTLFPSSHAANLIRLENGDLLCFWFSGTSEGDSDVGILESRLPRGLDQWTKPIEIDHQSGKSFQNPVPFQTLGQKVLLFHTAQDAGKGQSNAQVLKVTSDDAGMTWHGPLPLFTTPGVFVRQPPVLMDETKWMLPMYYTPTKGITTGATSNYSSVKISRDQGKTWNECKIPHSEGLVQPSVVRITGERYLMFLRSRYADWIYESTSHNGCTWTIPKPTSLPNNNSSIQAVRLTDGHLVIAFNNVNSTMIRGKPQTGPRKPLSVALSEDNGKSWPWVRDLEIGRPGRDEDGHLSDAAGGDEYSYPSVIQDAGGRVVVAYTFRRELIKVMSFDEEWIKQGASVGLFRGTAKTHGVLEKSTKSSAQ